MLAETLPAMASGTRTRANARHAPKTERALRTRERLDATIDFIMASFMWWSLGPLLDPLAPAPVTASLAGGRAHPLHGSGGACAGPPARKSRASRAGNSCRTAGR